MRAAGPMAYSTVSSRSRRGAGKGNGLLENVTRPARLLSRDPQVRELPPEALCRSSPGSYSRDRDPDTALYISMRSGRSVARHEPVARRPARSSSRSIERSENPKPKRGRHLLPIHKSLTFPLHRRRHSPTACSALSFFGSSPMCRHEFRYFPHSSFFPPFWGHT